MDAEAVIEQPARRLNLGSWLVLAIAIGYIVLGIVDTLLAFQQPTDGWYYSTDNGIVVQFSQGGAGPLQPGDRIVRVAGRSIDVNTSIKWHGPPPGWQIGARMPYTVVRDGTTLEFDVLLMQRRPAALLPSLLGASGVGNFAELFCLVVGFAVFFLRPRDTAARLLLLVLVYFMAPTWADSPVMLAIYPAFLYYLGFARVGLWPLMWAMVTHLLLSFPVRSWPLTRRPRVILALLYSIAVAGPLAAAITNTLEIHIGTVLLMAVLMFAAFFGTLIHNLRTLRDPVGRAQVRWMALGIAGPFLGAFTIGLIKILVPASAAIVDWLYGNVLLTLLPICLAIAITRYRLFDIEVIIRRTLVYSVLTLTLALLYVGSIVVLQQFVVPLTGGSELAIVASTLVIAALFFPLRRRIQLLIDRRFYRQKYDAAKVLAAFATTARDETNLASLASELMRVVDTTMQPEFAGLWLREPNSLANETIRV